MNKKVRRKNKIIKKTFKIKNIYDFPKMIRISNRIRFHNCFQKKLFPFDSGLVGHV
jgi:hypothetical protein